MGQEEGLKKLDSLVIHLPMQRDPAGLELFLANNRICQYQGKQKLPKLKYQKRNTFISNMHEHFYCKN